ncbi:MAG TPA: hypothetical protein VGE63_00755 [Candidatus Paceibacterota bacterium]
MDFLSIFTGTLSVLWIGVIASATKIIGAILIFIIGWLLASLVEKAIEEIFEAIKLDRLLAHTGLDTAVSNAGYNLNSGKFVGTIFKWLIIILFLKLALGVVNLTQVDVFLDKITSYIPSVIVATVVLFITSIVASTLAKIVKGSSKAIKLGSSNFIAKIVEVLVWVFGIVVVLSELNIAQNIVVPVFLGIVYGIIAMLAIAGGLAFGLGGKEHASKWLDKVER